MSVSRMKNLILLILSLTVLLLLALVIPSKTAQARQAKQLHEQLSELFAAYDVVLEGETLPARATIYPVELSAADEPSAAAVLLGTDAQPEADASRYERQYRSPLGSCSFSSAGAVSAELSASQSVRDPEAHAQKLLRELSAGTVVTESEKPAPDTVTVTATQQLLGVPVFSGGLTLTYEGGCLRALSGFLFPLDGQLARVSEQTCISCADALVRFLACRDQLGWVGSRVLRAVQGYLPTETASGGIRLLPVWRIETDTDTFYVNGITSEVTLAA